MADIIIRDVRKGEKLEGEQDYTQVSIERPRKVFNQSMPDLDVGHKMKVTMDTGGGYTHYGSVEYTSEIAPDAGKVVRPVIAMDIVEMNSGT